MRRPSSSVKSARLRIAGRLVCCWLVAAAGADAAGQPAARPGVDGVRSPWVQQRLVAVDPETWGWNRASWDQEKLVTAGQFQYTVFWDADGVLVLARRDLRDDRVQTLRLPAFRLSDNDAHRNTCLGISPADGRLHLCWDHHCDPLRYARSRAGFVTDPPADMTPADIEPVEPIATRPVIRSRVTYPRFVNDAGGRLFLCYRQGGSGNGDHYLLHYRPETAAWAEVGRVFSGRGVYPPWEASDSRNAYLHDLLFDAEGRLHATWVYREVSSTWASNHDLHYAWSEDSGRTWRNNAGRVIADLATGDAIAVDDPGIVVREIPAFSWLMNAGCMALDRRQRPHVITYQLPAPRPLEELQHEPPPAIAADLRFVHYWRDDDGSWRGGRPIAAAAESGVGRGDIVFDAENTLYFFYRPRTGGGRPDGDGFTCLEARAADRWSTWRGYRLTGRELTTQDASKHDRARWREEGILSFTVRQGDTGFAIVDFSLKDRSGSRPVPPAGRR